MEDWRAVPAEPGADEVMLGVEEVLGAGHLRRAGLLAAERD